MEKKNIKMVVCDIDDTLVHKELHLSADIINIIRKLKEKGIYLKKKQLCRFHMLQTMEVSFIPMENLFIAKC